MPVFTTQSITIRAGTHGDNARFPGIVSHIYDNTPDIIALEYNTHRFQKYIEHGFKNGSRNYPIGDIYLAIHAATDTNTPVALIDTADDIPLNADELYDHAKIHDAIGYTKTRRCESRLYSVSRQAMAELRARHPDKYVRIMANRDRIMAGHLQYLANNNLDVLAITGGNHLPGIADRLTGIIDINHELVTAPPTRTELPPLSESQVSWVRRCLPTTTHPARTTQNENEQPSHN